MRQIFKRNATTMTTSTGSLPRHGSHERQMRNREWRFVTSRLWNILSLPVACPYGRSTSRKDDKNKRLLLMTPESFSDSKKFMISRTHQIHHWHCCDMIASQLLHVHYFSSQLILFKKKCNVHTVKCSIYKKSYLKKYFYFQYNFANKKMLKQSESNAIVRSLCDLALHYPNIECYVSKPQVVNVFNRFFANTRECLRAMRSISIEDRIRSKPQEATRVAY